MMKLLCVVALVAVVSARRCENNRDYCPNPHDGDFARAHGGVLYCCDSSRYDSMDLRTANGQVSSCECVGGGDDRRYNDFLGYNDRECSNNRDDCDLNDTDNTRSHDGVIYCCSYGYRLDLITSNGRVDSCACRG